jgi:hypothetical protein
MWSAGVLESILPTSGLLGHPMAFFRNSTVNLLNLHYGVHSIALGGGAAFFVVYLLQSGVPAPVVFASLAFILLGRFVIRPAVVGLAARRGLRAMVVAGTLLSALQYPLLAEVYGVGVTLVALCFVSAVGDTIYWTSYHAYFATLGDDEHRGQQIGVREAIAAVVGVASPLATGWLLVAFGPRLDSAQRRSSRRLLLCRCCGHPM